MSGAASRTLRGVFKTRAPVAAGKQAFPAAKASRTVAKSADERREGKPLRTRKVTCEG